MVSPVGTALIAALLFASSSTKRATTNRHRCRRPTAAAFCSAATPPPPHHHAAHPPSPPPVAATTANDAIARARDFLERNDADGAFASLLDAFAFDPHAAGLSSLFEACMRLRIDLAERKAALLGAAEEDEADEDGRSSSRRRRVVDELVQDRFGLASLLIDAERYEEAGDELRWIVSTLEGRTSDGLAQQSSSSSSSADVAHLDRARAMLYRTNAACCNWDNYDADGDALRSSLVRFLDGGGGIGRAASAGDVPVLHPFEALKFPCVSLRLATSVAAAYARRALKAVGAATTGDGIDAPADRRAAGVRGERTRIISRETDALLPATLHGRRLRVGYLSPDFTSKHPLAFLMQDVFRCHDRSRFEVRTYSLSPDDDGPEVSAIRDGSDAFVAFPPGLSPRDVAEQIREDDLDVLIDLCGYAGSSTVAEILATRRAAPVQVSYMGFPGSSGAPYLDYLVCDGTVVPPEVKRIRRQYDEGLVLMPHCYFVNSHRTSARNALLSGDRDRIDLRSKYGLPSKGFVFCCHSRPDKIDPHTFRAWLRALVRVRRKGGRVDGEGTNDAFSEGNDAVLWLLRSGDEMERNLRGIARDEFNLEDDALVFCDVASRDEHLRRLGCADAFLDTPAYNAHTLGCDTLFAGVPMISLLRSDSFNEGRDDVVGEGFHVATEKLASRVGASLLRAAGLNELICPTMEAYENLMVQAALNDGGWYSEIQDRLQITRDACPLFDTERWVKNLELALREIVLGGDKSADDAPSCEHSKNDIHIIDGVV